MSQSVKIKNTKDNLVNSAIKTFGEKGFWNTRVSDIVKNAGVAQGTFYLYFKSKEDCFRFIIKEIQEKILSEVNQADAIFEVCKIFLKETYELKEIARIFLFEALCSGNEFFNLYISFKKEIQSILKKFCNEEIEVIFLTGFLRELVVQKIIFEKTNLTETIILLEKGLKKLKLLTE